MKKVVFLIFALVNLSKLSAQKVTMSPELIEPPRTFMAGVIYSDESGFVVKRLSSSIFNDFPTIERYDNEFNLKSREKVPLEYSDKVLQYERSLNADGVFFVFSSFTNQKTEKNYLFAQEIDAQTMTPKGGLITVCEVPMLTKANSGSFNIDSSPDRSKILIIGNSYYKKNEPERFRMQVHSNQGMVKLWEREITLPIEDQLFSLKDYSIDNEGTVYLMGRVFQETGFRKYKRNGEPNYHYAFFRYEANNPDPIEYVIDFGDKFVNSIIFCLNAHNEIVGGGFYSNKGLNAISGVCYFAIDKVTSELKTSSTKDFDLEFMEQFMSEQKAEKGHELFGFKLREIITRKDGGAIFLAEQYFEVERQSVDASGRSKSTTYYYYNHILVTRVGSDGQIKWCVKVPKFQVTRFEGTEYCSFSSANYGESVFLVFNDNPQNLNVTESSKLYAYNGRNSAVVMVEILPDGQFKKSLIFRNNDEGIILRPEVCAQLTSNGPMLLFGELKKKYKLGWLNF